MLNEWEVFNIKRVVPVHIQLTTTMEQDGQRDQYHFDEQGQFVELMVSTIFTIRNIKAEQPLRFSFAWERISFI